jgi:hypothetical protein
MQCHLPEAGDKGVVVEGEVDLGPVHPMRRQRPPASGVLGQQHQRIGAAGIPGGRLAGVGVCRRGGHQRIQLRRQQGGIRHRQLAGDPHGA